MVSKLKRSLLKSVRNAAVAATLLATAGSASAGTFTGARSDFRDETIYFAMTSRFYDGDHSNNTYCWDGVKNVNDPEWRGDFKGLIEKLDYIKALGFTAVWITPVVENASGLDYHGYHAIDFTKVDPRNESQDVKFQTLIDEVHKRGMKLILDVVLQHTGNFGEANLCPMFTKDYTSPSNHKKTMRLINNGTLPANYWQLPGGQQYDSRLNAMKNTKGNGGDPNNYWHHVGQAWDWDDYSRVWGQIAGDCVDLNTENPHVYNYIIDCYSNFIKMGVDGFRVDTSGHIARVTFNKAFVPGFMKAAEEAKAKRGGTPFYMFGEVCARAEEVIYRNQNYNCSPCFYTWAETKDYAWDDNEDSWKGLSFSEAAPSAYAVHPNTKAVLDQAKDYEGHSDNILLKSNNAWLNGNEYHTPDYSKSSHFNVIDFPMHWRFSRASNAFGVRHDDNLYNDATWNVVYVDGHDYGPNGWDKKSFGGSVNEWAENLSLMFTFRGIPCIWQGSETYFRKGNTIDEGPNMALNNTARAYYGGYLTGSVNTTDFAEWSNATGNLNASLNHPLALHLQRLNKIRAAVPALRKGQYSTDGCSGTMAFKRRYKDATTDSYVLVTISGGATFTGILNGKYTEAITGETVNVTNGTLQASCSGQGNMRIYVLNGPGKIGEDGQFLYASSPVTKPQPQYDGNEEAGDTETVRDTEPYNPGMSGMTFTPQGCSFRTETLTVKASLSSDITEGWIQVGNGAQISIAGGESKEFTIGSTMNYGESVTVKWGAGALSGSETYKKVDPNAGITVYVTGKDGANISGTNMYVWNGSTEFNGAWPGAALTSTTEVDGRTFYYQSFETDKLNFILNRNGAQTGDIKDITGDVYYEYDGGSTATKLDITPGPKKPVISADPKSGTSFNNTLNVTLRVSGASDVYYTLNGQPASASSTRYTGPISLSETTTINAYAKNEVGETRATFTYTKTNAVIPSGYTVYFDNTNNWQNVYAYCWDDNHQTSSAFSGAWPGKKLETVDVKGETFYVFHFDFDGDLQNPWIIFNPGGDNGKTGDLEFYNGHLYNPSGDTGREITTGVSNVTVAGNEVKVFVRNGQLVVYTENDGEVQAVKIDGTLRTLPVSAGYNFYDLPKGFYIVAGKKVVI